MSRTYKIAHFADVHWRGLSRHEEYKTVFTEALRQLKEERVDAIVIAGDIVHTKTQGISPEIIDHLTWWFNSFAEIAPTYVTLGNHDGLIHNPDRQDAISPIIKALSNDRVTLLKGSGNYPTHMKGVRIANFCPFDEEGWERVERKGEIIISIFHGVVKGALTDSDYATEGEVDLTLFKGCHYGMFGDIHRHQFLDREGKFAYPGSTIQQNFGESQDKGYLLWQISGPDDFKVERKLLESPHPYVTVSWKGDVESTIDSLRDQKKGTRFRIASGESLLQEEIKQLAAFLKEELNAHEIVWKWENEVDRSKSYERIDTTRKSLRDIETHRNLLTTVLKDDSNIDKYVEIVQKSLNRLEDEDEVVRNQKWTLDKLEWENTFSYGKDNVIDFNTLTGVVGLFGRNRIGKSSIPGTIMYSLFNNTDRGNLSNIHIVNTRKGHCMAAAEFRVDGVPYRAERQTVKSTNRKGHVSAATHLNLFKVDENGDPITDISGEQRKDSDKVLRSLVGTADDFLLTSFAAQGEMNNFIRQKATSRKALLSRFLDLHVLDIIHWRVKEEAATLKGVLKTMPDRNFRSLRTEYLSLVESCDKKITESENSILELEKEREDLSRRLLNTPPAQGYSSKDVADLELKLKSATERLESEKESLRDCEEKISEIVRKVSAIDQIKLKFPIDEMNSRIAEHTNLEKKSVDTRHLIDRESVVLSSQEKSAARLSEVPCGESFPTCKFIKDSIKDKKLIESQRARIGELKDALKVISNALKVNNIEDATEKVRKYNDALTKEKILLTEKTNYESRVALSKSNIEKFTAQLIELRGNLDHARAHLTDSPEVELASTNRRRLVQVESLLKTERDVIVDSNSKKAVTQEKMRNLDEEEKRLVEVKAQWAFYEKLLSAYGKDGIPMIIVKNELPRINDEIAKILQGVTGFTVTLETDDSGSDLDIYLDYGDSRRPIELGSGMEKMLSSLAIRVALINISCLPKSDILIIDEGFGALDEQNVEACNKLLHSLKRFFKTVLVISHVDAVKDAVDGFIEVTTRGADAHVSAADSLPNN